MKAANAAKRGARRGFATAGEARKAAAAMGWRERSRTKEGRAVFTDGKYYYSPDSGVKNQGGHKGGAWKHFSDSRCRPCDRIATLDRDLNVIGK